MAYTATDRERQRYLVIAGPDPTQTFERLFGVFGLAKAGLERHAGVLRCNAESVEGVRAAVALTPGARTTLVTSSITKAKAAAAA